MLCSAGRRSAAGPDAQGAPPARSRDPEARGRDPEARGTWRPAGPPFSRRIHQSRVPWPPPPVIRAVRADRDPATPPELRGRAGDAAGRCIEAQRRRRRDSGSGGGAADVYNASRAAAVERRWAAGFSGGRWGRRTAQTGRARVL